MMKENIFTKVLSGIHLFFWISLMFTIVTVGTGFIFLIPALAALFQIGREFILGEYNVYDSNVKNFFKGVWGKRRLLRFVPIEIILLFQFVGLMAAVNIGNLIISIVLIAASSLLLAFLLYVCAYSSFFEEEYHCMQVIFSAVASIQYFMTVWILCLLAICFINPMWWQVLIFLIPLALVLLEVPMMIGFKKYAETFSIKTFVPFSKNKI